jgi:hypothetical protein
VEVSKHRVFLLGENRWEEPSRLVKDDKQGIKSSAATFGTKCLTCRGEGRLMCTGTDISSYSFLFYCTPFVVFRSNTDINHSSSIYLKDKLRTTGKVGI